MNHFIVLGKYNTQFSLSFQGEKDCDIIAYLKADKYIFIV